MSATESKNMSTNLIYIKTMDQFTGILYNNESYLCAYFYKRSLTYGYETLPCVRVLADIYPTMKFIVVDMDSEELSSISNHVSMIGLPVFKLYNANGLLKEIYRGWKEIEKVEAEIRSIQFSLETPVIPDADDLRNLKNILLSKKFDEQSEMNVSEGSIDSRFLSSDSEVEGIDFD